MSPAKKFNPANRTPASATAEHSPSTSAADGDADENGHQDSTAVKPAEAAAENRER
jgi:hypothetical protein